MLTKYAIEGMDDKTAISQFPEEFLIDKLASMDREWGDPDSSKKIKKRRHRQEQNVIIEWMRNCSNKL